MGQSTSKPLSSKVFSPPPAAPAASKDVRTDLEKNPETDIVRQLYSEKYIEDRVAERLYEERISIEKQLDQSGLEVPELDDARFTGSGAVDARDLRRQVAALHKELTSRPLRGQLDDEALSVRERLVECLTKHKQQPLKCRETFAEFQNEVTRVEKKVAST